MAEKQKLLFDDVLESGVRLRRFIAMRAESRARGSDKAEMHMMVCLVFQSRSQRDAFNAVVGKDVRVLNAMYVDGVAFCRRFGIGIPAADVRPFSSPLDKTLSALVRRGGDSRWPRTKARRAAAERAAAAERGVKP